MEDYREKYEQAVERAKSIVTKDRTEKNHWVTFAVENIFPELKKSDEEKMRECAVKILKSIARNIFSPEGCKKEDVLAWLEKQGEEKSLPEGCVRKQVAEAKEAIFDDEDERIRKALIKYFKGFSTESLYSVGVTDTEVVAWLEKHTYTQRDVDDTYLKGVTDTKNELEKQSEQKTLRENGDEKVRKEIIDYCHERLNTTYGALPNIETIKRWLACLEKQNDVKFPEVPIEHGKYYYCIKDYYSGGNLRAKRGDVVQALRGMSMMILDSMEAGKYFLPVNKIIIEEQDELIKPYLLDL